MAWRLYDGPEDPILRRYDIIHSLGFGKMYPTKPKLLYIHTEVSSQFGFNMIILTIQSDISSNITNNFTENTTSDHGKVV